MPKSRGGRAALALLFFSALAAVGLVLFAAQPPCVFRTRYDVLCPACGTTRMVQAVLRLDFAAAFFENPFMFLLLPVVFIWLVLEAVRFIRGKPALFKTRGFVMIGICVLAVAVLFAVLRNFLK